MTDYDDWKTDSGEKARHPAPCSVCGEMFHDDELADGVCEKCESVQGVENTVTQPSRRKT